MYNKSYDSIKGYQNKEIENLIMKTNIPYKKYYCKIRCIEKWIEYRKTPDPIYTHVYLEPPFLYYNYSGVHCLYKKQEHISGPRLDVYLDINLENDKPHNLRINKLCINIYDEIMEITGYLKMSSKLSDSIQQNEGKRVELFVFENGDIGFNVRELMSLNYGYRGKL